MAAVVVFLVAYVLDPSAVARLIGACLAGQFGLRVRIASIGVLVLIGCVLAWALFRQQSRRSVTAAGKPRRRRSHDKTKLPPPEPEAVATPDSGAVVDQGNSKRMSSQRAPSRRPPGRS
jgi:hypothetical protein